MSHTAIYQKIKNEPLTYLALCVGFLAIAFNLYSEFFVAAYRHDALYYMPSDRVYWDQKLHAEGRWVIYYLFDFLKSTPGFLATLISLLSFGYFSFIVARRMEFSKPNALLVALIMLQIPSHYSQLFWPATSMLSFVALALGAFLASRVNRWVVFGLMGVLLLGNLMQYYYLIMLLYINEVRHSNIKALFTNVLLPWAGGFLLGYLVANGIVYAHFGRAIHFTPWRNAHAVDSLKQLFINIDNTLLNLRWAFYRFNYNLLVTLIIILAVGFSLYRAWVKKELNLIYLVLIVAFLHFLLVTYYKLNVAPRTYIFFYSGIWFAALLYAEQNNRFRQLLPIASIAVLAIYGYKNYNTVKWFSTITTLYKEELLKASLVSPKKLGGVVILNVDTQPFSKTIAKITNFYHLHQGNDIEYLKGFDRWETAPMEAGYRGVGGCTKKYSLKAYYQRDPMLDAICQYAKNMKPLNPNSNNLYLTYKIIQGRQLVSLNPNWDPSLGAKSKE